ncbi:FAD-dependent oxidoreductase [Arachidicoccus terrestris]|uniref:FAD-dependent oxidoreductase n=1 Tax=Arachidicoccus terrestris TaxID=2875539 RepID=UPI001CC7EBB5|nr:FAD-dependent oxidoreductase [Arachidicoccus terrestris]UAY55351.1 FAD-dependent oxidoreductase [Arachidicoccus terrestris]
MTRDSNTTSIWQETKRPFNLKTEGEMRTYDVIIIGAGITGLTTGLFLQEARKKCLILEARNIGFGTTSGTTAHLNTVLDTPYTDLIHKFGLANAVLIAEGAKEAIALIKDNMDRYDILCDFEHRDGYMFAETQQEAADLDKIYDSLKQVNINTAFSDSTPVPIPFVKAIKFSGQAQFHPLKYLFSLAEAFQQNGGIIMEEAAVEKVDAADGKQVVCTLNERYIAHSVVYATHIPFGLNALHFKCAPYRSYLIGVLLPENHSYPEALIYDMKEPYHYFRTVEHGSDRVLLIGGNDHKTGHKMNTEHVFAELEAYVRRFYDIQSVIYKWSAQYYEPSDGLPYIGHLPGADRNVYVATGFSGNGMIFGTLSGRILTDLIVSGESQYKDLLSPSRIKPLAAFKNMVRENLDVVKHFVADRLSVASLPEFADLSKGEGKVVRYKGEKIAIYKDLSGALKALHPVCPHAGCIVEWNNAERSWDCPCHGARYDIEGRFLNGPSASSLKVIPLDQSI